MLAEQQRLHARAVDEQIARQRALAPGLQRGDVAVVVRVDADDVVEHVAHAEPLDAVLAQEQPELAGVEVVGVVGDGGVFRRRDLLGRLAVRAQVRLKAHQVGERNVGVPLQPAGDQVGFGVALRQDEGMKVVVVLAAVDPAVEPRALLERGVAFADEVGLGHADSAQRVAHRRPGAFADADGTDIRRFEQRDLQARAGSRAMLGRDDGRGQPAGRPAAHDHDLFDHVTQPACPVLYYAQPVAAEHPQLKRKSRCGQRLFLLRAPGTAAARR